MKKQRVTGERALELHTVSSALRRQVCREVWSAVSQPSPVPEFSMRVPASSDAPPPSVAGDPASERLTELDIVRTIAFTAVIAVHALGGVLAAAGVGGTAALALMLVTRKAFFVLLALVATRSWMRRPTSPRMFWRRRLPLVGLPFLAWTAIYGRPLLEQESGVVAVVERYLGLVLTGDSAYHMYFLVASLQAYLLLPLVLPFLWRLRNRSAAVLAVSAAVQVALHVLIEYSRVDSGPLGFYRQNCGELVLSYQLWLVIGVLAAMHFERVQQAIRVRAGRLVIGTVILACVVVYVVRSAVEAGHPPGQVSSTFSPFLLPWYVAAIVGTYALATIIARSVSAGGLWCRLFSRTAEASFGVYLAHPLVLPHVGERFWAWFPATPVAPGVLAVTLITGAVSLALVSLIRRTPASTLLCGRPRIVPVLDRA